MKKIDYSDEGREEFYKNWFNFIENEIINNNQISESGKLNLIKMNLTVLKEYESLRKQYFNQIKQLIMLKKNSSIIKYLEKEIYGTYTNETIERDKKINEYEENLRRISKSFDSDLEKIIGTDMNIKSFKMNLN